MDKKKNITVNIGQIVRTIGKKKIPNTDINPIDILRKMCKRDEDGFLIITPDIDLNKIVECTGAKGGVISYPQN